MAGKIHIQLGRTGDLLTMLPVWRQSEVRTRVMVASEFAPVLDGASYVDPIIFDGPYHDLAGAVEKAKAMGEWVCTQVNAPPNDVALYTYKPAGQTQALTTSFQKEMWRAMGKLSEWDNMPPLVFDQRSKEREAEVLKTLLPPKRGTNRRPFILISLGGTSSPFKGIDTLEVLIRLNFGKKYDVIDISQVRAHRFYDLLALYEKAQCLVATDSAPLHLARAVPDLPVFALVNDSPLLWNGSAWMPNHIWYCRYGDFAERGKELLQVMAWPKAALKPSRKSRLIIHVWNNYDRSIPPTFIEGYWPTPIWKGACGRDSKLILKDEKRVPYLRDCIRMGLQRARDNDLVILTRPDTCLSDYLRSWLATHENALCYCYRQEAGMHVPVVDFFCASKAQWKEMLPEIPDLLFGGDYFWSHALWAIFQEHKAYSLPTGYVYRIKNK